MRVQGLNHWTTREEPNYFFLNLVFPLKNQRSWQCNCAPRSASQLAQCKESACQCRICRILRFNPWVGKILWRRKWKPTPVFSPGESSGQRGLAGYSPWDFPGKKTGVGCHFLLQRIFPTQGSKSHLWHLLHCQADSLSLSHLKSSLEKVYR